MGGYIDKIAGFFAPRDQELSPIKNELSEWNIAHAGMVPSTWKEPSIIMRDLLDAQSKDRPRSEREINALLAHPYENIVEFAVRTHALTADQLTQLFSRSVTSKKRIRLESLLQGQARRGIDAKTMNVSRQQAVTLLKRSCLSDSRHQRMLESLAKLNIEKLIGTIGKDTEIEFRVERSDEHNKPTYGSLHIKENKNSNVIDYLWYHDESTGVAAVRIIPSNPKDDHARDFLKMNNDHLYALLHEYATSQRDEGEFFLR